jgi:hypothetical protein
VDKVGKEGEAENHADLGKAAVNGNKEHVHLDMIRWEEGNNRNRVGIRQEITPLITTQALIILI